MCVALQGLWGTVWHCGDCVALQGLCVALRGLCVFMGGRRAPGPLFHSPVPGELSPHLVKCL